MDDVTIDCIGRQWEVSVEVKLRKSDRFDESTFVESILGLKEFFFPVQWFTGIVPSFVFMKVKDIEKSVFFNTYLRTYVAIRYRIGHSR